MKRFFFLAAFLAAFLVFFIQTMKVPPEIKIVPPRLADNHLGTKIICHRPMRVGSPKMTVKKINDKIVAHNYGHGGSGWTLAPGSSGHVISLLEDSEHSLDLNKETDITIIGAGALGLFTAYDLHRRGYKNITIVAENFYRLTSHNAGGLLAPVSMDNKPQKQALINKIGVDAYKFYESIASKHHIDFSEGASIIPTYFETREESGLEPYVKQKVMKKAKDVILNFGNGTKRPMVLYDDGIFIDTAKMMTGLTNYLRPRVKLVQKKINDFSEIESKYIVNCAGWGSKKLNNDKDLMSVQGHLIMLNDQNISDLQYMILVYFKGDYLNTFGQKIKRSFYIFPKQLPGSDNNDVGVIGGTFIEGATADTPNNEEFAILVDQARQFYGLKSDRKNPL